MSPHLYTFFVKTEPQSCRNLNREDNQSDTLPKEFVSENGGGLYQHLHIKIKEGRGGRMKPPGAQRIKSGLL